MLKTLKLTCFRKHEDLAVEFGEGLHVLRGPNESGKSTLLEGILYAYFGSRVLRTTLDETVTAGHPDRDLRVELTHLAEGHEFRFQRSKAGATLLRDGVVFVTGQDAVSTYAAQLLGADFKTASVLMLAGQSDLLGALTGGPTAVSSLISKLADFDLIDRLLDRAQADLTLGAEAPFEQRVVSAQAELDAAHAAVPKGDPEALRAEGALLQERLQEQNQLLSDVLIPERDQALAALTAANERNGKLADIEYQRRRLTSDVEAMAAGCAALAGGASAGPSEETLAAAEQAVRSLEDVTGLVKAYAALQALPKRPAVVWDEGEERFNEELQRMLSLHATLLPEHRAVQARVEERKRARITSGKCPTCGHAAVSDEHVATHNAKVDEEVRLLEATARAALARYDEAGRDLRTLQDLQKSAAPFLKAVKDFGHLAQVVVDLSLYPPTLRWEGAAPDPLARRQAEEALTGLRRAQEKAQQARGALAARQADLLSLQERLAQLPAPEAPVDTLPLAEVAQRTGAAVQATQQAVQQLLTLVNSKRAEADLLEALIGQARQRVTAAESSLQVMQAALVDLRRNNLLVRKLKGLKPLIADKLWAMVLAATSTMFSQLRGTPSVVSKDSDGFKVNGAGVSGLSGSTQDVLALALRVALTKTFVPGCMTLTLDEPAHGSDVNRTGNILGFLAGAGFPQVLLASHDELSESVADRVILLGGDA